MKENNKKKTIAVVLMVFAIVAVISVTYAFITQTLTGTKKVTLTAGTLSLVLNEENVITISDALPMYDQVGMIQEDVFVFSLVNNTAVATDYTLKLQKVSTSNELSEDIVKYYLTKEGVGEPKLLSTLTDGVIDEGTIVGNDTIDYTLRLWIDSSVTDNTEISGKSLSYMLKVEATQADSEPSIPTTVTFAGITKNVSATPDAMFDYTSEGRYITDYSEWISDIDENYITNGIYVMDDDDGPSYFFRGEVNNLVKFGEYTKDYYVYRYASYHDDFSSLEACKFEYDDCSEAHKVLKYTAGTPMYWRIIRVNGDGTIRMIYAGTTPDAILEDTGIGVSRYNEECQDPKYTGYTYDRTTNETKSDAKTEIDNWYSNVLEGTIYDNDIATGKFCSDSSGYEEVVDVFFGDTCNVFGPEKRIFSQYYDVEGNSSPTFKCAPTTETYGGSYNLKVGLITSDEIIAAGGQEAENWSYYLFNGDVDGYGFIGCGFWSMSPTIFRYGTTAFVGEMDTAGNYGRREINASSYAASLRPVINLRSDVVFKEGTDGSTTSPYEIE